MQATFIVAVLLPLFSTISASEHLVLYRPGRGAIFILQNENHTFSPIYAQGAPGTGIGTYDLQSRADRAFAFDYLHSGMADHIVLYRPGRGAIYILARNGSDFTPVFAQGDPGNGIGGYDLKSSFTRAFAFDYDHSGKLDHIVLYRAGSGTLWILKNAGGSFSPVFNEGEPGNGIGGYDLASVNDRVIAFDYDGSGREDHLVLFRPGSGIIRILRNSGGVFVPVFTSNEGIGGYDLKGENDRMFALDYEDSGKLDHLVLYRAGAGAIYILKNEGGSFTPVYWSLGGIGGFDLKSVNDRAVALDYDGSGRKDHILLMRAGLELSGLLRGLVGVSEVCGKEGMELEALI